VALPRTGIDFFSMPWLAHLAAARWVLDNMTDPPFLPAALIAIAPLLPIGPLARHWKTLGIARLHHAMGGLAQDAVASFAAGFRCLEDISEAPFVTSVAGLRTF